MRFVGSKSKCVARASLAVVALLPALAAAETRSWDWTSGDCGGSPGGLLSEQVVEVEPGSQVCVLPPSYDMAFGPRVYVGTYIDGQLFVQTSSPDERCRAVSGPTATVRSDTICSADPARQRGRITFTAPAGPPPTTWDFTYSYTDPTTAQAQQHISSTSNAQLFFENPVWFWKPIVGGGSLASAPPAVITYHFPFAQTVEEAHLFLNMPTFHWSYSRGLNRLYGSRDGTSWQLLMEVTTPGFGGGNGGFFNADLPASLLGGTDIWLRAELYSFGSSAHLGSVWTNTAQHSRYDINSGGSTSFTLDVNFGTPVTPCVPIEEFTESERGLSHVDVFTTIAGECDINVSVDSWAFANGSALDGDAMESEAIGAGAVRFFVDQPRALFFNVSIGGVLGGGGLFESLARIEGRLTEDGVPLATFSGDSGSGIDRRITLRPVPWGFDDVRAQESHPYTAVPGREYAIEFDHRLLASATLAASHAFANFSGSTKVRIDAVPVDRLPVADAGPDRLVAPGSAVLLDGTGSFDPDGGALGHSWTQVGGEIVALSDPSSATPTLASAAAGSYRFELVVEAGGRSGVPDYVNLLVAEDEDGDGVADDLDNCPAVANPDQTDQDGNGIGDACEENQPPEAVADAVTTDEDVEIVIPVLANDSDPDGDELAVSVTSPPGHGSAVVNPNGSVSYTPAPDFSGSDGFEYTIDDGAGHTASAPVTVEVLPVNDPPALSAPSALDSDEGDDVQLVLSASDPEGDPLSFSADGLPPGLLLDPATGVVSGALGFDSAGVYAVTLTASDGELSAEAALLWTVVDVNRAPVAVDDEARSDGAAPATIPVLDNDSDPDGDPLRIAWLGAASFGELTVAGDEVVYHPRLFETLQGRVDAIGARRGPSQALRSLLENVQRFLLRGDVVAARAQLRAYEVVVGNLERQGRISAAEAGALADPVRAFLGGGLADSFAYRIDDGRGGSDEAVVTVSVRPQW